MVREEADEEAKNQIKTKKRSAKEWLQLVIKLLKAKKAARRAAKDAKRSQAEDKQAKAKPRRSTIGSDIPR